MARLIAFGRKGQPLGYGSSFEPYAQTYVIAVTAGELVIDHGAVRESVTAGRALVLAPGACFRLSTPRQAYRGHFAEFAPESVPLPPRATVLPASPALRRAVVELEAEYAQGAGRSLLPELSTVLGLRCLRLVAARPLAGELLCARIDELLRSHLHTADPLASILAGLPCSLRHAARRYRQLRGRSIKQAQLALKCAAAETLLCETTLSITAIAFELGFPSSQHFATTFRRISGRRPSALRAG